MYDKAEKVMRNLSSIIFDLRAENESLYDTIEMYSGRIDELREENNDLKKKQRFHKNGVFSLEYDKETLCDMVEELQQENEQLRTELNALKSKINEAIEYIKNNALYYEDYDYDINEELYLADIVDSDAKQDLLNILQNGSDEK